MPSEPLDSKAQSQDMDRIVPTQAGVRRAGEIHKRKEEWFKQFAGSPKQDQAEVRKFEEKKRSNPWLTFMIITIVSALVLFMMIPVLENFIETESTASLFSTIKEFISFVAPILIIVSAVAGTAGYFRLFNVAWFMMIGHATGYVLFAATIHSTSQITNLGVYWIILLSFIGGFLGALIEFIRLIRKRVHLELLPLLFIGFFAFGAGGFVMLQFTVPKDVELLTYQQAARRVDYQLYEPAYLPVKFSNINPRMFLDHDQLSVYYGEDHYPPPPIIDFLSGIEIIQSKSLDELDTFDPEPGVVFVDISDGVVARFTERRGRASIEWDQSGTHILLNIYSNISSREMFRISRTLQPALTSKE